MKLFKIIAIVAVIAFTSVSCKDDAQPDIITVQIEQAESPSKNQFDPNATYAKAEFGIEGMTCAMGCAKMIEKKIANMEGVKTATVDFDKRIAMVEYDNAKVTTKSLEEAVISVSDTYSVNSMNTVDAFTSEAHSCGAECEANCEHKL